MVKKLWQMKRRTLKDYNLMAGNYDLRYREEQSKKYDAVLDRISVDARGPILDVGCGTGLLIERLAGCAPYIVAIDFSEAMLSMTRERCKAFDNVLLVRGDADFLPLRDDAFDNVFAFTLLQNIPEPKRTLRELARVAKPGASMAITGLRKRYAMTELTDLIDMFNLRLIESVDLDSLKDHIIICRKPF